jgi:flagellin
MVGASAIAIGAIGTADQAQSSLSLAMARLATGRRITKAADDAAGLAISQEMTAQVDGLGQEALNDQADIDASSTAAGLEQGNQAMLQQMRTLALQAANGTNSAADDQAIQAQESQLGAEIGRDDAQLAAGTPSVQGTAAPAVDVTSAAGAQAAISSTGAAIGAYSTQLAALGAQQNGLQADKAVDTVAQTNLSAANSDVADTDMAAESTVLAQSSALEQLAVYATAASAQQSGSVLGYL